MRFMGGKFGEGVTNIALKKAKYTLRTLRYAMCTCSIQRPGVGRYTR
jgi:hypothetical protein